MTLEWSLNRLQELRTEYADGESQLLQLDRHRAQVQDGLLRVSGAIRVLEELVAASGAFAAESAAEPAVAPPAG